MDLGPETVDLGPGEVDLGPGVKENPVLLPRNIVEVFILTETLAKLSATSSQRTKPKARNR